MAQLAGAAGYFSSVAPAFSNPARAASNVSGPGYTTDSPGPGFVPALSTEPQSCAAWRTKGKGLAQPLIFAAIVRMRSVADAPTPPQSSHALRYPGALPGLSDCAERMRTIA